MGSFDLRGRHFPAHFRLRSSELIRQIYGVSEVFRHPGSVVAEDVSAGMSQQLIGSASDDIRFRCCPPGGLALDQISIAADTFKRHWHVPKPNASPDPLTSKMDVATKVEFGQSLSNLLRIMGVAIRQGLASGNAVTSMPVSEFIDLVADELACEKNEATTWIDFLSLSTRGGF